MNVVGVSFLLFNQHTVLSQSSPGLAFIPSDCFMTALSLPNGAVSEMKEQMLTMQSERSERRQKKN